METREEWPKYHVGLIYGVPVVKFSSTNPESIEREAKRLWEVGLEVRRHFTVKLPEGGLHSDPQGGLDVRRLAVYTRLGQATEAGGGVRGARAPEG
jgi:hypothetical protein